MTECDRLKKEGFLPASFFEPETICDFYVDENRKKVWAISIDLLKHFDAVCRKYNLKYFLASGSLLGIVRHNGFIPWDDDIDVFMPRKDYEFLITNCKNEFTEQYYLQIPCVDKGYYYSFTKLRNSNTSSANIAFRYQGFNQGLFLDIFPIDNCYLQEGEENYQKIKELLIENSTNMKRSNPYPTEEDLRRFDKYPARNPKVVFDEMESIARRHEFENTEYCTQAVVTIYHWKKNTFKNSTWDNLIEVDFYGLKVFIPSNYDEILRICYGDYMEFPPVEKRGTWHGGAIFDADRPYVEVVQQLRDKDNVEQYFDSKER